MTRRAACLALSPIARDGRVLRQLRALTARFDVTAVGYDPCRSGLPADLAGRVRVVALDVPRQGRAVDRLAKGAWLAAGRLAPALAYPRWYARYELYRSAASALVACHPELVVANDWNALPAAEQAAEKTGAALLVDLHEYAPRQWEHRRVWRWLWRPAVVYFLHRHLPRVDGAVTVSARLAAAYAREFGVRPAVVRNAPAPVALPPFRPCRPDLVRLIHHGVATPARRLERTIDAVAAAGAPFHLDLMLVSGDEAYIERLRRHARDTAPDRVRLRSPVPPDEIVTTLSDYDAGLLMIPPITWHYRHALPNKLFEFVAAGLCVCTAPSPDMAAFVRENDCGAVADGHTAHDMARLLASLTPAKVDRYRRHAREAGRHVNAHTEAEALLSAAEAALRQRDIRREKAGGDHGLAARGT